MHQRPKATRRYTVLCGTTHRSGDGDVCASVGVGARGDRIAVEIEICRVGWRRFRGSALVVDDSSPHLHRLNAYGTRIWEGLAVGEDQRASESDVAAFLVSLKSAGLIAGKSRDQPAVGSRHQPSIPTRGGHPRPRLRAVAAIWELVNEIAPCADARYRSIGAGFVVRSPGGRLTLLHSEAAELWRLITIEPQTFSEILDATADRLDVDYEEAEATVRPLLGDMVVQHLVSGLEHVQEFHSLSARQGPVMAGAGRVASRLRPRVARGKPRGHRVLYAARLRLPARSPRSPCRCLSRGNREPVRHSRLRPRGRFIYGALHREGSRPGAGPGDGDRRRPPRADESSGSRVGPPRVF